MAWRGLRIEYFSDLGQGHGRHQGELLEKMFNSCIISGMKLVCCKIHINFRNIVMFSYGCLKFFILFLNI